MDVSGVTARVKILKGWLELETDVIRMILGWGKTER